MLIIHFRLFSWGVQGVHFSDINNETGVGCAVVDMPVCGQFQKLTSLEINTGERKQLKVSGLFQLLYLEHLTR